MILNNCLIHKEMALKNRREMAVFGSSGGSISSQLHIVDTYDSSYQRRTLELSYEDCYTEIIKITATALLHIHFSHGRSPGILPK